MLLFQITLLTWKKINWRGCQKKTKSETGPFTWLVVKWIISLAEINNFYRAKKGYENMISYRPMLKNALSKAEDVSWSNTVLPLHGHLLGSSSLWDLIEWIQHCSCSVTAHGRTSELEVLLHSKLQKKGKEEGQIFWTWS